jgi:hypothetical protein
MKSIIAFMLGLAVASAAAQSMQGIMCGQSVAMTSTSISTSGSTTAILVPTSWPTTTDGRPKKRPDFCSEPYVGAWPSERQLCR